MEILEKTWHYMSGCRENQIIQPVKLRLLIEMLTVREKEQGKTSLNTWVCKEPSTTREQHWPFFLLRLVIRLGEAKSQHFDVNHSLPELNGISPALSTWILDYNLAQLKLTCPQNKSATRRSKQLISQDTLHFTVSENNRALGKRRVKSEWKSIIFFITTGMSGVWGSTLGHSGYSCVISCWRIWTCIKQNTNSTIGGRKS